MARIRTDIVVIEFTRRTVNGRRVRIIQAVRIIGTASPCNVVVGRRVGPVRRCLLNNRFRIVSTHRNTLVFERRT